MDTWDEVGPTRWGWALWKIGSIWTSACCFIKGVHDCEPAYIKLLTMMDEVPLSPVGPTVRSSLVGFFRRILGLVGPGNKKRFVCDTSTWGMALIELIN